MQGAGFQGALAVQSQPSGASVFINGTLAGTTPLLLRALPVGSRVVSVMLDGHQRWSASVSVIANQTTRLTMNLAPIPGATITPAFQ